MADVVLSGSLGPFKLPDVLTFLHTTQKSGTLSVTNDRKETHVFFDAGSLIYAGSNQEPFRLGSILLRKRKITKEQSDQIDELMRHEGGRFGEIAVQQEILSDEQLRDFLKIQVSEVLYDCFIWSSGVFGFVEDLRLPDYAVTISVDLSNLIMEGARRIEEWEECLKLLPDRSVVFRVIASPGADKITLTADEWKVLFLINGKRTLEELCHDAADDPFKVYRVVYGLQANKLLEIVPPDQLDQTAEGPTRPVEAFAPADSTVRQSPAVFHAETTIKESDADLLLSSDARFSYHDVVRPTVAQLVIRNGEAQGQVFPLTDPEYLVGRDRQNAIHLSDLGISGFHARIFRGPDGYVVEDLKSRNGVWLNGTRVFQAVLRHGDQIRLGTTILSYSVLFQGTQPGT